MLNPPKISGWEVVITIKNSSCMYIMISNLIIRTRTVVQCDNICMIPKFPHRFLTADTIYLFGFGTKSKERWWF